MSNAKARKIKRKIMPTQVQKETYDKILSFYDTTEEVLDIAEAMGEKIDPIIDDVEKLADELERNTESLMDNFLKYMQSGKPLSGVEKLRMEKAKEDIIKTIDNFIEKNGEK